MSCPSHTELHIYTKNCMSVKVADRFYLTTTLLQKLNKIVTHSITVLV